MMKKNLYMINMQKLLHLAGELHRKGYTELQVIPSLSPSGVYWRCDFINANTKDSISVSNWMQENFDIQEKEVSTTEIVKRFEEDHNQFFLGIESEDEYYSQWFSEMLKQLEEGELPYAFSDYYNDPDYWQTNTGKKIKTLN